MNKMIKEPLLIFLLFGGALFGIFSLVSDNSLPDKNEIIISEGRIQALRAGFEKVWQRSPTNKELNGLIQNYIREEVFYREALAMGLDQNDGIVRRRLYQKMTFISEDLASFNVPEEIELQTYYTAHKENYRQPSYFSFQQIYFNTSKRGQAAKTDAKNMLATLQSSANDNALLDVSHLGDLSMLEQQFNHQTEREIKRALGSNFLKSLRQQSVGQWQGPILSGYGLHLVRIDKRNDGTIPALDNVREIVLRDLVAVKRKQTNEAFYRSLRQRYRVLIANYANVDQTDI